MAYPSDTRGLLQQLRDTLNTGAASTAQYPDSIYGLLQNIRDLLNSGNASTSQYPKDINGLLTNIRDLLNTGSASTAKYTADQYGLWQSIRDFGNTVSAPITQYPQSVYGAIQSVRDIALLGGVGISPLPVPVLTGTTFDPVGVNGSNVLSNSNLTLSHPNGTTLSFLRSLMSVSSGKWCAQFVVGVGGDSTIEVGLADHAAPLSSRLVNNANTTGCFNDGVGTMYNGASFATTGAIGPFQTAGDIVTLCIDVTAKKIWGKVNNGLWNIDAGADPAAGTNGKSFPAGMTNAVHLAACVVGVGSSITLNPTPAAGSIPAGFTAWAAYSTVAIDVVFFHGQSNASGGHQTDTSISWRADPNVMAWDHVAGVFKQYAPNVFTGTQFNVATGAWGADPQYIRNYRAANPTKRLAIVKITYDGTQLYQSADGASTYDWNVSSTAELYAQAGAGAAAAIAALTAAGYVPTERLYYWSQGENDASDATRGAAYAANLAAFVAGVRDGAQQWKLPNAAKFVIVRCTQSGPGLTNVRAGQASVAAADVTGPQWIIDQDDLAKEADTTHYTNASQITLGNRLWAVDQGTYTQP